MNNIRQFATRALWVGVLLLLVASGGLWLKQVLGAPEAAVRTVTPTRGTLEHKTTATGQIVPRKEVKVKSQINGVLDDVKVRPGQWVKRGDLIATIRLLPDPVEVNNAQSQLHKTHLEYDRAAVELDRRTELHAKRLISDSAFQDDRLKYQVSREAYERAQRELDLRLKGASQQLQTTSTRVYATIDGLVLEQPVEVGDFVIKSNDLNEGTTIVTLADMTNLLFKGEVEESDAGRLKEGMPIQVEIGALPEERFEAELEYIAPKARRTEQGRITFEIRAALKLKPEVFVRAGYSATGEIVFARHENVLIIPESHVLFRDKRPYVKVETEGGRVEERPISTGLSDGLNIEVSAGLDEQQRVVAPPPAGST